jgi:hypothetical protein
MIPPAAKTVARTVRENAADAVIEQHRWEI